MNNQTQEWKHRALEAEAAVEEGLDLVRDLLKDHYLQMRETQANAFQIICQIALQEPTADSMADEQANVIANTISAQLDAIRDQEDEIDRLREERDKATAERETITAACNTQLEALTNAYGAREQQIREFARLWDAAYGHLRSPLGSTLTRKLYRIMADAGVDVSEMPDPRRTEPASTLAADHAQLLDQAREVVKLWRAAPQYELTEQLNVAIASLSLFVDHPETDTTDCA